MSKPNQALVACALALCASTAWAQAYPSRPITLIVPYPPGGLIDLVARAAPDGHMLLMGNPSLALSQHIYPKLNYRPLADFAYVGQYGTVPNELLVNPSLPATASMLANET